MDKQRAIRNWFLFALLTGCVAGALFYQAARKRQAQAHSTAPKLKTEVAKALPPLSPVPSAITKPASIPFDLSVAPPKIKPIVDPQHPFLERQQLVRSLPNTLSPDELRTFYGFLLQPHPEDNTQRGHVLKSDLMDALVRQTDVDRELAGVLTELYQNPAQHAVLRDYAIQHLAMLFERLDSSVAWPADLLAGQREHILNVLWTAATSDSTVGGTALLALNRLLDNADSAAADRLATVALRFAADPTANSLLRISAFQVCGHRRLQDSLPLLVHSAQSETEIAVRIAAIGSLGALGDPGAISTLRQIETEGTERLRPAITLALHRLEHPR